LAKTVLWRDRRDWSLGVGASRLGGVDPAKKEKSAEEHFSKSTAAEKVMSVSGSGLGAVWVAPGPLSEPS